MKRKLIAMLFLAVHVTGCHSWRTATITPAQLNADEPPPTALLTLKDGTRVRFNEPTIRNDSINGVAFSDVSTITTTARRYGPEVELTADSIPNRRVVVETAEPGRGAVRRQSRGLGLAQNVAHARPEGPAKVESGAVGQQRNYLALGAQLQLDRREARDCDLGKDRAHETEAARHECVDTRRQPGERKTTAGIRDRHRHRRLAAGNRNGNQRTEKWQPGSVIYCTGELALLRAFPRRGRHRRLCGQYRHQHHENQVEIAGL